MRRGRILLRLGVLLALGTPLTAWSQGYNNADYVRNLFRKYVNREPTSNEVTQWAWTLNKGGSAQDLQVALLASNAYYRRYGSNPNGFIGGLFNDVLSRAPSVRESTQWVRYFDRIGGDRGRMVRTFLQAAAQELTAQKPVFQTPQQHPVDQLVATAQLLSGALQSELGGLAAGRQAVVMGRNLLVVTQALQRTLRDNATDNSQAYHAVRIALTALEDEMRWNHLSAPTSSWYLSRFSIEFDKLANASESSNFVPLPGQSTSTGSSGMDNNELVKAATALLRDTQQVIYSVRSITNRSNYYNQLLRDLEFFSSQVDAFQHTLYGSGSIPTLRSLYGQLRTRADGVSRSLRFGRPAGNIVQDWRQVSLDLEQVAGQLGVSQGAIIDPGAPVLFNSPTFHHLPYQLQYSTSSPSGTKSRALIDSAIAQIDAFSAGFTPLLPYLSGGPELQAAARDLRNALTELENGISWNTPANQLKTRLDRVNRLHQALTLKWRQTVAGSHLRNIPTLQGVSKSIEQLNQLYLTGNILACRARSTDRWACRGYV